ncbi:MAG: heavy-metal-associated domain-containing protein [Candidatus Nanopelagicales bacterium]
MSAGRSANVRRHWTRPSPASTRRWRDHANAAALNLGGAARRGGSDDRQRRIRRQGMTCRHCVAAVTEEVAALPGVVGVAISLVPGERSTVQVTSEAGLDRASVAAAVAEAGTNSRTDPSAGRAKPGPPRVE